MTARSRRWELSELSCWLPTDAMVEISLTVANLVRLALVVMIAARPMTVA